MKKFKYTAKKPERFKGLIRATIIPTGDNYRMTYELEGERQVTLFSSSHLWLKSKLRMLWRRPEYVGMNINWNKEEFGKTKNIDGVVLGN